MKREKLKPSKVGAAFERSLNEFVAERDSARHKENQDIARSARTARSEARELRAELDHLKHRLGIYEKMQGTPFLPPEWHAPAAPGKGHHAIPTLFVSDWHWGETVDPAQIMGINAYSVAIAGQRMKRAFTGALHCRDLYFRGIELDGWHVAVGGTS